MTQAQSILCSLLAAIFIAAVVHTAPQETSTTEVMPAPSAVSAASNALEQTVLAKGIHAKALVLDAHADIEIPGKESRYVGDDGLSKVSPEKNAGWRC